MLLKYSRNLYRTLLVKRKIIFYTLIFSLSFSCSQLNTDSREHFNDSKPFRHGSMGDIGDIEYVKTKQDPISAESAQRGKSLYNNYCISCHGASGQGDGPQAMPSERMPKNLAALSQRVKNLKIYMVKSHSEGTMPGWKPFFSKQNIVDLEHYIRTFASKK